MLNDLYAIKDDKINLHIKFIDLYFILTAWMMINSFHF